VAGCSLCSRSSATNSKHKKCLRPHLLNSQTSSSCWWGWRRAGCGPRREQPATGSCPAAVGDLEIGLDSAHPKRSSPCPGQEDVLGLHPVEQEVFPCLPDRRLPSKRCSRTAPCLLLPCSS